MLKKVLSYVLVAVLASAATFGICAMGADAPAANQETSKLEELEALIVEKFIGEADEKVMEDGAAAGMVASLGDRWSNYLSAEEFASYREQMSNSYVGIGITISVREDEKGFDIIRVEPDGPAAEAGIQPGDMLIRAEGQEVGPLGTNGAREIIIGEEGTSVQITVLRDGKEITVPVMRRTIITAVATGEMLEGNIGLVTIANFNDRCAEESIAAIEALLDQGAKAFVFDLRFNPGGYAHELVALLDYLLPEGELFRTVDYKGNENVDMSDADCLQMPMAVLVNGESYSAAEFFAAALRDYDYAAVVGQPTVGKGYFQQTFQLSDGSAVGLSTGKYFTPKGVSLAEVGGLVPDVVVEVDDETAARIYAGMIPHEEDAQLQAAVDALTAP